MTDSRAKLTAALASRHRLERELGAGGMATVYLAHDVRHDRKVAVKVLRPELAAVLGADRFVQEIRTTAQLQHPHILPLFDSGEADGFLFYVMPYVEGETLRNRLDRETQLDVEEAVRITREVADALDYAHRHGIIHRDIKPENILLHDGRPTVADFGIALALSAAAGGRMTETGMSLGTPHHMSPEQATADKDITARSDIYSLASVLYEMLVQWSPDGVWIVLRHIGAADRDVVAFRPGTDTVLTPVAAAPGVEESSPRLSPDGRWLAYVSDETGRNEVFVRPFPGDGPKQQVSLDGGEQPRWARSGRELFFRDASNQMTAVQLQVGGAITVSARQSLFDWGELDDDRWDVAPDNRRFLFVRTPVVSTGGLVVVENFAEELKAKVPR